MQLRYEPDGVLHDLRVPECEVEELLDEELPHLIGLGLVGALRVDVDVLGDGVYLGQIIPAPLLHFVVDLLQLAEMDLYPLVDALVLHPAGQLVL